jgi:hypothetical protein
VGWLQVAEILIRLFGPLLAKWLERLLNESAREMGSRPSGDPFSFMLELDDLFDRARRKTWAWNVRKRAVLRLAGRMARERSEEIRGAALSGGFVPPLTTAERNELKSAAGH